MHAICKITQVFKINSPLINQEWKNVIKTKYFC